MAYEDNGQGPKLWTIYDPSSGVFWRAGGDGYTASVTEAGLFSEEFARRMTGPSYRDRREEARHLKSFRYILADVRKRADELAERFASLESPPARDAVDPVLSARGTDHGPRATASSPPAREGLIRELEQVISGIEHVLSQATFGATSHPESPEVYLVDPDDLKAWRDRLASLAGSSREDEHES